MPVPDSVVDLCERFARNADRYKASGYNETQVRVEFVDPLFEALGWDVHNRKGWAEEYKDVVHEARVKVGGSTKAPDYAFRIGSERKFFVEAKKPAVNIRDDVSPAFQLRRYAWTANLPLSILTDFEEFAVYDCRFKPDKRDPAKKHRPIYYRYEEYPEKWDEIAGLLSKDAVMRGSFDRYARSNEKRGTEAVDDAFLSEIERWRRELAEDVAVRNPALSETDLNFAVQRTIDRIVFLRICEDRGIEPAKTLHTAATSRGAYRNLLDQFKAADERYNSGLFHFQDEPGRAARPDTVTSRIKVGDDVLAGIVGGLYYPDSSYEFSELPAHILGNVYERFLGNVIRLDDEHRAVVEPKPEVRRKKGVYYTPVHVVREIVDRTLGRSLDGATPDQAARVRVVDPACGSGSFLIEAYQHLLDWHLAYYAAHDPEKYTRTRPARIYQKTLDSLDRPVWALTTAEKKRVLLNSIFGVDIDEQAVEVTKLSLLLKVLEGESAETLRQFELFGTERVLPDLGENVKCGNALVGGDFFDAGGDLADAMEVRPFEWADEFPQAFDRRRPGFDVVIANPPYDVLEKDRGGASWPHDALHEYVGQGRGDLAPALGGKLNLFRFFVVRSLGLTRSQGHAGMIVPMSFAGDVSTRSTREHALGALAGVRVDCFPQKDDARRRIFRDAKLSTCVVTGTRGAGGDAVDVRTYPWDSYEDDHKQASVAVDDLGVLDASARSLPLVDEAEWALARKVHGRDGAVTLGTAEACVVNRGEVNQSVYRDAITAHPPGAKLVKGAEVAPFFLRDTLSQGARAWFHPAKAGKDWKRAHGTRIVTQRITGVDERLRIVAALVEVGDDPVYLADSTNSVAPTDGADDDVLHYLLGLLNSELYQWRFRLTSTNNNVGTGELKALPYVPLSPAKDHPTRRLAEAARSLSSAVESARRAASDIERRVSGTAARRHTDAIDTLVYELFGLDANDVRLVEQRNRSAGRGESSTS